MLKFHVKYAWQVLCKQTLVYVVCYTAFCSTLGDAAEVDPKQCLIWGPGLKSHFNLPVRYFYIQAVDVKGEKLTDSVGETAFQVTVTQAVGEERVRLRVDILDRHDGVYIVRLKPFSAPENILVSVKYGEEHVAESPYKVKGPVYQEKCYCPVANITRWYEELECPASYDQIDLDLSHFPIIDMDKVAPEAVSRFSNHGRHSLCHYKIIDNKVYRKTHGSIVDFKMFMDAILLSLVRKVRMPDVEFFVNLGDWPLEKRKPENGGIPILSWCGSDSTFDVVMPTYDITEATLEMLGRVSLDMFSVQANTGPKWADKSEVAFWRGRDSREERLKLAELSQKHPDMVDAALTFMFFFPKNEEKYGPTVKPVSFFDFFKSKYQLNIDGTVAAYRFPYLLAGDAVVLKQDSEYYEHFYKRLSPWRHYIPLKRDLSDIFDQIKWARNHDDEAHAIAQNAQQFARENLHPAEIFCYHVKLFEAVSKRLKKKPVVTEGFELLEHPTDSYDSLCECKRLKKKSSKKDEL
ncbi:protein O-glucosyltransferase 2-like [Littorina saxatilis]|uniref:Glycosyl transferase CAP10 domain-containing protein n=1 Tax=Littorina saxatilis TaxID=31220 RepID=A0AAN9C1M8_9CAEN